MKIHFYLSTLYITLFLGLISLSFPTFSQTNKETKKLLQEAENLFYKEKYNEALALYRSIEPIPDSMAEISFHMGVCYYALDEETKALTCLRTAKDKGVKNPQLHFYLGSIFHRLYAFKEAISEFEAYRNFLNYQDDKGQKEANALIERSKLAQSMVQHPVDCVKIKNLGSKINSKHDDFSPILSVDESYLIFTSRRENTTGAEKDENGEFYEDIYLSYKLDTIWSKASNIRSINTESHDACLALSADGEELILYRATPQNGGDLFISYLKDEKWSTPVSMGTSINSAYWEPSATVSSDGNCIIFSSNRKGGYGGLDLYLSVRKKDGEFSEPLLLGPDINTEYDEDCPFLHADGKTLYFSSNGKNSMGGFDIFYTSLQTKTGLLTSEVKNIGYPINTTEDDVFFVWSADGKRAYFSSQRPGGFGKKDIYQLERKHTNSTLVLLKGKVTDSYSGLTVNASIHVKENNEDTAASFFHSNPTTGKYSFVLKEGKSYRIQYSAPGYDTAMATFDFSQQFNYHEITHDVILKPRLKKVGLDITDETGRKVLRAKVKLVHLSTEDILFAEESRDGHYSMFLHEGNKYSIEINKTGYLMKNETFTTESTSNSKTTTITLSEAKKGSTMVLNTIYFASGSEMPLNKSLPELIKIVDFLKENPSVKLQILAHTDEVGSAAFNLKLSQKRAYYIASYIVSKGIEATRLTTKGFGESVPAHMEEDEQSNALNRRVEFKIMEIK